MACRCRTAIRAALVTNLCIVFSKGENILDHSCYCIVNRMVLKQKPTLVRS